MPDPITCACGAKAVPYYEEVDIGVGVQRFHTGWECPEHGSICGVCASCGIADRPGYTHHSWCREHPSETITVEAFEAKTDKIRDAVVARFTSDSGPSIASEDVDRMTMAGGWDDDPYGGPDGEP